MESFPSMLDRFLDFSGQDVVYSCNHDLVTSLPAYICESCLNGIVESGEQCDPWDTIDPGCVDCLVHVDYTCETSFVGFSTCELIPVCGDGIVQESCDDGNLIDYDGCTDCQVDEDFTCEGEPSVCDPEQTVDSSTLHVISNVLTSLILGVSITSNLIQ